MRYAIIASEQDPAGMNIRKHLLEDYEFIGDGELDGNKVFTYGNTALYTIKEKLIHAENIDEKIDAEIFIFASQKDNRCSFEEKQEFLKRLEDKYQEMVEIYLIAKTKFEEKKFLEAIKKADEAMYYAKTHDKDQVVKFSQLK